MISRARTKNDTARADEENPYWISFSDIMAGLLIIFILASLILIVELLETREQVDSNIASIIEAEEARGAILREIRDELERKNILIEISDNESVLRIPNDLLAFETDRYSIPQSRKIRNIVYEIGRVIYERVTHEERWQYLDTIFVEGHTDSRRSYREMGNWGLSAYRAISIWNYWLDSLPDDMRLEDLVNHENEKLFSVSGYAETRPVVEKQLTEADYVKNRRIDIRFTIRKPGKEDFRNVIRPVEGM